MSKAGTTIEDIAEQAAPKAAKPKKERRVPISKERAVMIGGVALTLIMVVAAISMLRGAIADGEIREPVAAVETPAENPIDPAAVEAAGSTPPPIAKAADTPAAAPKNDSKAKARVMELNDSHAVVMIPPTQEAAAEEKRAAAVIAPAPKEEVLAVREADENVKRWAKRIAAEIRDIMPALGHFKLHGRVYSAGDAIEGYYVEAITATHIRFKGEKLHYNLRLKGNR